MTHTLLARPFHTLTRVLLTGLLFSAGSAFAQTGVSQVTTWTCGGSNCPWGTSTSGLALVWPNDVETVDTRYDYTLNRKIYLPASRANGTIIWIDSGVATLYAGPSNASHRSLITLTAGQNYVVSGLGTNEVLSVQGYSEFTYQIDIPDPQTTPPPTNPPPAVPTSKHVTWNCTSSPCDWGQSVGGEALVWPASASPTSARMGYTTSDAVYLPASTANRVKIWIDDGAATLYAGTVNGSARALTTLYAGQSYQVTGLAAAELLSVQGYVTFKYRIEISDPAPTDPPPTDPPPAVPTSESVTWNCTSSPCDWGQSLSGEALVWPASAGATTARFGYTTSKAIYLPAATANRVKIWIDDGAATLYAGPANGSARSITTLYAGQSYEVGGLAANELLSVQGYVTFKYTLEFGVSPGGPSNPPPAGDIVNSQLAEWLCNLPGCDSPPWYSAVISWPSNTAYQSNGRQGDFSRSVFTPGSEPLYPYMGSWADGCTVTSKSGSILIIEWKRGSENWRSTWVYEGQTYTIDLQGDEDGAMIESYDGSPGFSATISNCTPQPLP